MNKYNTFGVIICLFVGAVSLMFVGCGKKSAPEGIPTVVQEAIQPQTEEEYQQMQTAAYRERLDKNIQHIEQELAKGTFYSDPIDDSILDLGKAQDPRAIPTLCKVLEECPVAEAREYAARAIGWIGDPAGIPVLKEALKDKDYQIKTFAAVALVRLGAHEEARSTLKMIALKENVDDWELNVEAPYWEETGEAREKKKKNKIARLKNSTLAHWALISLAKTRNEQTISIIRQVMNDNNTRLRVSAARYLVGTKHEDDALTTLEKVATYKDANQFERIKALNGLIESGKDITALLKEIEGESKGYVLREVKKLMNKTENK